MHGNFKKKTPNNKFNRPWFFYLLPIVLLTVCTLTIGLFPQPFLEVAERAAEQLLDPSEYIQAVLVGGGR